VTLHARQRGAVKIYLPPEKVGHHRPELRHELLWLAACTFAGLLDTMEKAPVRRLRRAGFHYDGPCCLNRLP
jgi:hypothetical protein